MRYLFLVVWIMVATFSSAQEINKVVLDSEINKEVLIGMCNRDGFKNELFKTWFDEGYSNYLPDANTVKELKKHKKDLTVTIVMATWCGDTREQLPRFFKIADEAGLGEKSITMIAVNRSKSAGEVSIEPFSVTRIPVFIVYKNGLEIGRITESPTLSLEKDMLLILMQAE